MAISKIIGSGLGTINSPVEFTSADNSTNLLLTSTDAGAGNGPNVRFYRNSATPADDDLVGGIVFDSRNDNSQDIQPVRIRAYTPDVSDGTEDGAFDIATMTNGALSNRMDFLPTETIFNNSSIDVDFRVEGNGNANALFVEGATDQVGIGTNDPARPLSVFHATAPYVQVANNTSGIAAADGFQLQLVAADLYQWNYENGFQRFGTNNATSMNISAAGEITMPRQPAFLARPASLQSNIPINATTTIVFGTEIFDQNADFASNTFTAPVTGKYQLNVQLMIQEMDKGTDFLAFSLITSNRSYTVYWDNDTMAADSPNGHGVNIVVLTDMDASDTAYVNVAIPNSGAAQMDVTTTSAFSGYLVA